MPKAAQNEDIDNEDLEDEDLETEETEEEGADEETLSLAKSMGWVDEDKFRGDKDRWVGADKFVERGLNDLPVLRERLRSQSKKINDMETDISSFKTYHEETLSREYQRASRDLSAKQLATVEEGDTDAYQQLEKQKHDLAMAHARNRPPQVPAGDNPLYKDWKEKTDWFEKKDGMTAYANSESEKVAKDHPEYIGKQEFLEEVDRRVKKEFPDYFDNPRRKSLNSVESGGRQARSTGSHSYSELPADAKAACDKFVRRGQITRKQYLETYEWD